jgi:precorrin-3B synthase
MTMAALRQGWCPTAFAPMPSGDGWLVRVKPEAANLSADQTRRIAAAARAFGNGHIDLTARANLQARGLTRGSAGRLAGAMVEAGLAVPDPATERVRNILADPLGSDDPAAQANSHALARALGVRLREDPELQSLPDKFGFLVDAGVLLPLSGVGADIEVRAQDGHFAVSLDGGGSAVRCGEAESVDAVMALARAFLRLSRRSGATRMRALRESLGEPAIFADAGLVPVPVSSPAAAPAAPPIGVLAMSGRPKGVFGAGLPFGRIEAEQLAGLAELAERFGGGCLRSTPWRVLLITDIAAGNGRVLAEAVAALGLIADPGDPRLAIHACVGAPSCRSASVETRADAARLAASGLARDAAIHVSGCAKGCAHREAARFTLVGRDGRYDLVRDGTASDPPEARGLDLTAVLELLARERQP